MEISGNKANQGGGIFQNNGVTRVFNTEITNNTALAGFDRQGGGLFMNSGLFTASESSLTNNSALTGGGLYMAFGEFNASDTSFSANEALHIGTNNGNGGAIYNENGTITISRGLLDSNEADFGGGVFNRGTTHISDTTISNNEGRLGASAVRANGASTTNIERATIVDNVTRSGLGGSNTLAAGSTVGQVFNVQGSIIARNTDLYPLNLSIDTESNLIQSENTPVLISAGSGDQGATRAQIDAWLAPSLTNNSHGVDYYELIDVPGNLAINQGDPISTGQNDPILDATGASRNGTADIGAFEVRNPSEPVTDGPTVITNEVLRVEGGVRQVIDTTLLSAIDPNTAKNQIIYKLTTPASSDSVLWIGNNPQPASTPVAFTQQQIESGDVSFLTTASGTQQIPFLVTDGTFQTQTHSFTVLSNTAPVLDPSNTFLLNDYIGSSDPGTTVSDILSSIPPDRLTDSDPAALEGIALVGVDESNGIWWYKINPTDPWLEVTSLPEDFISENRALLLDPDSTLLFVPSPGFAGDAFATFRAHDWTSGETAGSYYDIFPNGENLTGGSHPNSVNTATIVSPKPNSAPVLADLNTTPIEFNEIASSVQFAQALSITDETNIHQATVAITNFIPGEDELIFSDIGNISGAFNSDTGVLTLTGVANAAQYQGALQSVHYDNLSEAPTQIDRNIEITVEDRGLSSNTLTTSIVINAENDPPEFVNLDAAPTFITGTLPIYLDNNVTVRDPELDSLNSGLGDYSGATVNIDSFNPDVRFYIDTAELIAPGGTISSPTDNVFANYTFSGGNLSITFTNQDGEFPTTALVLSLIHI